MTPYTLREADIARFWSKIDKNGPLHPVLGTRCWDYTGARFKNGDVGAFKLTIEKGVYRQVRATRIAFEIQNGPLGEFYALHKCDRPICCRGDHLFKGTALDNERDKIHKGRLDYRKGSSAHCVKLTEALVLDMRARRATGESFQSIALSVGVSLMTCWNAIAGRTWRHV